MEASRKQSESKARRADQNEMKLLLEGLHEQPRRGTGLPRKLYEAFFCAVLCVNLVWVIFDWTYLVGIPFSRLTFRDFYLEHAPLELRYHFTEADYAANPNLRTLGVQYDPALLAYDRFKGIQRHRDTDLYLQKVEALRQTLAATGPASRDSARLLAELRDLSVEMVDKDPFQRANKSGTLERIKNRMRQHMRLESGKGSFRKFFSEEHLTPDTYAAEMEFFYREIVPLLNQNYFRPIGEDGDPVDEFYRYDLWFVLFFWCDFLVRWLAAIARKRYRAWYVFAVRHWYELFNLIPIHHQAWFRLLRVIPFLYRMSDNRFLPESGLAPQIIHENAGIIAEEISGMVMLNILEQVRTLLEERGMKDLMTLSEEGMLDEVQELLESQSLLISQKVIPQVEPYVAELVEMSIRGSMKRWLGSPLGPAVRPILENVNQHVRQGLEAAMTSAEGRDRLTRITQTFVRTMLAELVKDDNVKILEKQVAKLLRGMQSQVRVMIDASR